MIQPAESIISPQVLSNLHHKNQDRKEVAYRTLIEKIVIGIGRLELLPAEKVIVYFTEKYFNHPSPVYKRIAIEMFLEIVKGIKDYSQQTQMLLPSILSPILECFNQPDPKIRFQAIKAIFTISKEVEGKVILKLFCIIFDQLIGKMADLDLDVLKAADYLNESLKSLLVNMLPTTTNFGLKQLVVIIAQKIKSPNSIVRQYLLSWIDTLNEIHSISIIPYLPILLRDLLLMLGDKDKDVKMRADQTLKSYIDQIEQLNIDNKLHKVLTEEDFNQILMILIELNIGKTSSHTKKATIAFFEQLVRFVMRHIDPEDPFILKKLILIHLHEILKCIFVSLSNDEEEVRRATLSTNEQLRNAVGKLKGEKDIDLEKLMSLLNDMLQQNKATSFECVLSWTKFVLENYNHQILPSINETIVNLIRKICDSNSANVLNLFQSVSMKQQYFDLAINRLLNTLSAKGEEARIEQILNKLCTVLSVQRIFLSIASQVLTIEDSNFIGRIAYALNSILVTYDSTLSLRKKLRNMDVAENRELFRILLRAFSYNPVCALSLCFLSEQYLLSRRILTEYFGEVELSSDTIIQLCKIVNLLESSNFIYMRMHLLEKEAYPELVESMFLLLMILPQNKIYNMLKSRLDTTIHTRPKQSQGLKNHCLDPEQALQVFHAIASKVAQ